jgi:hypothetical protein
MGRPLKNKEVKPVEPAKEIFLDDVILEYLSTKEDNYGNDNVFFKISNQESVKDVMDMDTRTPMWLSDDDDILMKVNSKNMNSVIELEKGKRYESIINLVRYSFTPKDKTELMEGYSAKIMKLTQHSSEM